MTDITCTRHAETRMQQRGIREKDIPLIIEWGTQVDDEAWIALKRDVAREIEIRKREIQVLRTPCELQGRDARQECRHRLSLTASGPETRTTPRTAEGVGETIT